MKSALVRTSCALGLVAAGFYAFVALRGPHGIPGVIEKHRTARELAVRNAGLARENQLMRERIRRLAQNPAEQEIEVRRRLKVARPNEWVFIIPGERESSRGADKPPSQPSR